MPGCTGLHDKVLGEPQKGETNKYPGAHPFVGHGIVIFNSGGDKSGRLLKGDFPAHVVVHRATLQKTVLMDNIVTKLQEMVNQSTNVLKAQLKSQQAEKHIFIRMTLLPQ